MLESYLHFHKVLDTLCDLSLLRPRVLRYERTGEERYQKQGYQNTAGHGESLNDRPATQVASGESGWVFLSRRSAAARFPDQAAGVSRLCCPG